MAAAAVLGTRELFVLARTAGVRPLAPLGILGAVVFPLGAWWMWGGFSLYLGGVSPAWIGSPAMPTPYVVALFALVVLTGTLWRRAPGDRPLAAGAITFLAPFYCGALPSFVLGIRYGTGPGRSWPATWAVFFPLAVTWICDTLAMFGGKALKGPKLAPVVSPGKTRSGAVSGVVGGILAGLVYAKLALEPSGFQLPLWQVLVFGLVLSVVAQIGDLAESLFKREAGVKDSGGLIPGHGGVLDRLDSLYFVLPVAAMLYRAFGVL